MENTYTTIKIENLISEITIKYFMYGLMIILPVYYQFVRQKYKKSEEKDVDYHDMMETKKNTEMTKNSSMPGLSKKTESQEHNPHLYGFITIYSKIQTWL